MRPAYNGDEQFFEQNKQFLKNLLFLRQKIVINIPKNWIFQKIIGGPKFCSEINGKDEKFRMTNLEWGVDFFSMTNLVKTSSVGQI